MERFNIAPSDNPCFKCENRVPPTKEHNGCHATCDIYKEWSEKRQKTRELEQKKSQEDWDTDGLRHKRLTKIRKKMLGPTGR